MQLIQVNAVTKEFKIYKRTPGFRNALKSIFYREYEIKKAVDNISFSINKGELVGYIGPNGAGKSTTIKMIAGILLPTSGEIIVDRRIPHKERKENAAHIGIVFGQRSQLYWDLPIKETFDLYKKIYRIDNQRYKKNLEFYIELLEMKSFMGNPVRQLSLGQKMRADIALSLLHDPDIIYLDEPTIGLDLIAKIKIRNFIREVNKEKKTTVLLTTHDIDDIDQICDRIITIDKGKIVYDGALKDFKKKYSTGYILTIDFLSDNIKIEDSRLKIIKEEGLRKWFLFQKEEIPIIEAINLITSNYKISDLSLKEPDIEQAVQEIYKKQRHENSTR